MARYKQIVAKAMTARNQKKLFNTSHEKVQYFINRNTKNQSAGANSKFALDLIVALDHKNKRLVKAHAKEMREKTALDAALKTLEGKLNDSVMEKNHLDVTNTKLLEDVARMKSVVLRQGELLDKFHNQFKRLHTEMDDVTGERDSIQNSQETPSQPPRKHSRRESIRRITLVPVRTAVDLSTIAECSVVGAPSSGDSVMMTPTADVGMTPTVAARSTAELRESLISVSTPTAADLLNTGTFNLQDVETDDDDDDLVTTSSSHNTNAPEPTSPMTRSPEESIPLEASPEESIPLEVSPEESIPLEVSPVEASPVEEMILVHNLKKRTKEDEDEDFNQKFEKRLDEKLPQMFIEAKQRATRVADNSGGNTIGKATTSDNSGGNTTGKATTSDNSGGNTTGKATTSDNSGVTTHKEEPTATTSFTVGSAGTCGGDGGNSSLDSSFFHKRKTKTKKPKRNNKTTTQQKSRKKNERQQDKTTSEKQRDNNGEASVKEQVESPKTSGKKKIIATKVEESYSGVTRRSSTRKRKPPSAFKDFTEIPVSLATSEEKASDEPPPPPAEEDVRAPLIDVSNEQQLDNVEEPKVDDFGGDDHDELVIEEQVHDELVIEEQVIDEFVIEEQVIDEFVIDECITENDSQNSIHKNAETIEIDMDTLFYDGREPFSPIQPDQVPVGTNVELFSPSGRKYADGENGEGRTSAVIEITEEHASAVVENVVGHASAVVENVVVHASAVVDNVVVHASAVVEKRASKEKNPDRISPSKSTGAEKQSVKKRGRPRKNADDKKSRGYKKKAPLATEVAVAEIAGSSAENREALDVGVSTVDVQDQSTDNKEPVVKKRRTYKKKAPLSTGCSSAENREALDVGVPRVDVQDQSTDNKEPVVKKRRSNKKKAVSEIAGSSAENREALDVGVSRVNVQDQSTDNKEPVVKKRRSNKKKAVAVAEIAGSSAGNKEPAVKKRKSHKKKAPLATEVAVSEIAGCSSAENREALDVGVSRVDVQDQSTDNKAPVVKQRPTSKRKVSFSEKPSSSSVTSGTPFGQQKKSVTIRRPVKKASNKTAKEVVQKVLPAEGDAGQHKAELNGEQAACYTDGKSSEVTTTSVGQVFHFPCTTNRQEDGGAKTVVKTSKIKQQTKKKSDCPPPTSSHYPTNMLDPAYDSFLDNPTKNVQLDKATTRLPLVDEVKSCDAIAEDTREDTAATTPVKEPSSVTTHHCTNTKSHDHTNDIESTMKAQSKSVRAGRTKKVVSYVEPSLNKKLRRGDPIADASMYDGEERNRKKVVLPPKVGKKAA